MIKSEKSLLSYAETLDDRTVTVDIDLDKIVEEFLSLADHLEKTAAGMIVLGVSLKMLCELVDPLGKDSDLDFGRTCVALVYRVLIDNALFFVFHQHC